MLLGVSRMDTALVPCSKLAKIPAMAAAEGVMLRNNLEGCAKTHADIFSAISHEWFGVYSRLEPALKGTSPFVDLCFLAVENAGGSWP